MAKSILPEPGTTLSVEWKEIGPLIKIEGNTSGLVVSLGLIAGQLDRDCNIPVGVMRSVVSHGGELLDRISVNSMTVDMHELERQAAAMAKEDEHEDP